MTEKRFTIIGTQIGRVIRDNETDINTGDISIIFDWLNELAEENKALKSDRARYEEECRLDVFKELSEENEQLKQQLKTKHIVNKQYEELQKVKEENEQLKQDIENLKITIDARETLIDVCEKKFKELGYIITAVDDDGYVIE